MNESTLKQTLMNRHNRGTNCDDKKLVLCMPFSGRAVKVGLINSLNFSGMSGFDCQHFGALAKQEDDEIRLVVEIKHMSLVETLLMKAAKKFFKKDTALVSYQFGDTVSTITIKKPMFYDPTEQFLLGADAVREMFDFSPLSAEQSKQFYDLTEA